MNRSRQAISTLPAVLALVLVLAPKPAVAGPLAVAASHAIRISKSQLTPTLSNGDLRFIGYVMFVDEGMKKATVDVRFTIRGIAVGPRGVSLRIHRVQKMGTSYVATGKLSFAGVSQTVNLPMRLATAKSGGHTTNRYRFNQTLRGSR